LNFESKQQQSNFKVEVVDLLKKEDQYLRKGCLVINRNTGRLKTNSSNNNINIMSPTNTTNGTTNMVSVVHSSPGRQKGRRTFKSPKKSGKDDVIADKNVTWLNDAIITQSIFNVDFFVASIVRKNGDGGFIYPVIKAIQDGNQEIRNGKDKVEGIGAKLVNRNLWDCRMIDNVYFRVSREINLKVKQYTNSTRDFYRTGIVCSPNQANMITFDRDLASQEQEDVVNYLAFERKFRDEIELILHAADKLKHGEKARTLRTKYDSWNPDLHSATRTKGFIFLDHVFIDESVGNILKTYYVKSDVHDSDVYKWLKENGCNCFFSRYKGFYSSYAQSVFGFPNDNKQLVQNAYISDDEDEEAGPAENGGMDEPGDGNVERASRAEPLNNDVHREEEEQDVSMEEVVAVQEEQVAARGRRGARKNKRKN
jgi:hypothetical protein